ncbi:hypothetical protein D3C86_657100 [compost metagenome]
MKKILFLLLTLVSAYSYAQADFPEGVQISGGQPTVTNDPYLTTTGTTGVQGKIAPVNVLIPYTPINYTISGQTIGQQIAAIDAKIGTMGTTSAGVTQRVYFTADNTVVNSITYFASSLSGKGSTASGSPPALVLPDNTKAFFTKDVISIAQPSPTIGYAGTYSGNLTVSASPTPVATQQRFTVEIYRTDNLGVPIASGVSGAPVGDLGVTVLAILDSGIINLTSGSITNIAVSGSLTQNITLNTGERLRYHVSAAKIGAGGGNVTFGVYYGTSYNSYYDIPVAIRTNGVLDDSDVPGAVTDTDALNYLYNSTDFPVTAYVQTTGNNSTAQLGNIKRPFLTIDAALDALPSTGGVIRIGTGSFLSPAPAKIKSNCKFFGQGKPITNSVITYTSIGVKPTITSPTKLVGGTILLGKVEVSLKDGVEFHDLGVDSGLDYCNTYTAGVAQEGLIFVQEYNIAGGLPSADGMHQLQTNSPPRTGIVVNNVSALCKSASSAVHAMLIENTLNAKVSNVSTYYGIHGLVLKSIGATVDNFDGHGHSVNGLIFKSNDYAYGFANSVSNVYLTSIGTNDCGGVNFVQENGINTAFHNLSNVNIDYCTYGIKNDGFTEGNNISNVNIYKTQGIGLDIDADFTNSTFSGIDQREGTTGYLINQNLNTTATAIILNNCKSSLNSARGFDLTATNLSSIRINNSFEIDNATGNVLSGNVYGSIQFNGSITGTFKYASSANTEVLSTIDTNGKINKSAVQLSSVMSGSGTGNFIPKFTGTNTFANSAISETSTLTTIPILSNDGSLAIVANPALVDNVPRIELNGTANADPNKISIRGNKINFTASGGSTPYGSLTTSGLNLNSLTGSGDASAIIDASGLIKRGDAVVSGVKRYKALISQTGTSDPTVIVLDNSLGFTPVWTRTAIGAYEGSMPGIAPDKTIRLISGETNDDYTFGISMGTLGGSHLKVTTRLAGVPTDSLLNKTSIIVEVYP